MEHFIFLLLSQVPEQMREKDEVISESYRNYEENDLKKVENIDASQL